jgi:hypothetical protein
MRLTVLLAGLLAIAPVTKLAGAQSPPDFSGFWTMVSPETGYPNHRRLTISQSATTLTIDSTITRVTGSTDGISSETSYPARVIYTLDGVERPTQLISDVPAPAKAPAPTGMSMRLTESLSKATWAGRQLVIMTYQKLGTTAPARSPAFVETRRTVRDAISIDQDGLLVWETLIVADPLPWGREVKTPVPFRRTFKKG